MTFTRNQTLLMAQLKGAEVDKETAIRTVICLKEDNQISSFRNWISSLHRIPSSTEIDQKVAEIVIDDRKRAYGVK